VAPGRQVKTRQKPIQAGRQNAETVRRQAAGRQKRGGRNVGGKVASGRYKRTAG